MQKLEKSITKLSFFITFFYINILNNSASAIELNGSFIQGGLLFGKTQTINNVFYNDKNVPVDENGEFIIGIGRNHPTKGKIEVIENNNKKSVKILEIKQRNYKIQKINNLNKSKVTPPEKFFERIKSETRKIKAAKKIKVPISYYNAGFEMPAQGIITGVYGSQRVLNGIPKRPHYGIDIANKLNSPVLAPSDGVIVMVEKDLYFSGGTIIISHGRGLSSSLLHLNKILVKEGNVVSKGQLIGLMGETGRATGSHLDWRMELRGIRIDPYLLIHREYHYHLKSR